MLPYDNGSVPTVQKTDTELRITLKSTTALKIAIDDFGDIQAKLLLSQTDFNHY